MEGFLEKSGGLSAYKKHFFRMQSSQLLQFKSNKPGEKCKKYIPLENGKLVADRKDTRVFRLTCKGRNYLFRAKDQEMCNLWLEALKGVVREHDVSRRSGGSLSLRSLVSKKKVRYTEDGFNLDLTYITDSIIAMGYPATGAEAMYRNPLSKVKKLLSKKHPGNYKVYNLCSEKTYDSKTFQQFAHFPFTDHNTCPLHIIKEFCDDVHEWLEGGDERVVAIHCKAGKGRAGMMISSYLIRAGICDSAEEALQLFGDKRCYDARGVTIPSQRRSVEYYEKYLKEYISVDRPFPFDATVELVHVRMYTTPNFDRNGGCNPYFEVRRYDEETGEIVEIYDSQMHHEVKKVRQEPFIDIPCRVELKGDMKIRVRDKDHFGKDDSMLWLWLNAAFCPKNGRILLPKDQCDGAMKENKKCFADNFRIVLYFGAPPTNLNRSLASLESQEMLKSSSSLVRALVSKKKVRFVKDGFDLDLTYITPQLIAMGYPSEGTEAVYRNPMSQVQKMLKTYHPARFKVYNLCAEREYKAEKFGGEASCAHFGFFDHNASPLKMVYDFCLDVEAFLKRGKDHVVAVHCKAGKGRTGMMLSCYLLHCKACKTAEEALTLFADKRTADGKGVTIASQIRYVHYYERFLKEYLWKDKPFKFYPKSKLLHRVKFGPVPIFDSMSGGCLPYFHILDPNLKCIFKSTSQTQIKLAKGNVCEIEVQALLTGDCKLVFYHDNSIGKDDKMMWCWLNTEMEGKTVRYGKKELDGASKKHKKIFENDFVLELSMEEIKSRKISTAMKSGIAELGSQRLRRVSSTVVSDDDGNVMSIKYPMKDLAALAFSTSTTKSIESHGAYLAAKHPSSHKVYNLGNEPIYDKNKHGGKLSSFDLSPLEPASLENIVNFCKDVQEFLKEKKENVACIYYKNGNGVMMTACFLLWDGRCQTSRMAVKRASVNFSDGVKLSTPQPSQIQRVADFEMYLKMFKAVKRPFPFEGIRRRLQRIILHTVPRSKIGVKCKPWFRAFKNNRAVATCKPKAGTADDGKLRLHVSNCVLKGENKLVFYDDKETKPLFWIWVHTSFIPKGSSRVYYEKSKIDEASKDISCNIFHEEFMVEVWWEEEDEEEDEKNANGSNQNSDGIEM
mmetsp:Transcript_44202/g.71022  ORF Transcript_44202/g.71022 Transcript_44202/m.71022 type:complete len:1122 (+) Transcript_44202:108-3473(+)